MLTFAENSPGNNDSVRMLPMHTWEEITKRKTFIGTLVMYWGTVFGRGSNDPLVKRQLPPYHGTPCTAPANAG